MENKNQLFSISLISLTEPRSFPDRVQPRYRRWEWLGCRAALSSDIQCIRYHNGAKSGQHCPGSVTLLIQYTATCFKDPVESCAVDTLWLKVSGRALFYRSALSCNQCPGENIYIISIIQSKQTLNKLRLLYFISDYICINCAMQLLLWVETTRGRGVHRVLDVPCFDKDSTVFIVCPDAGFDHQAKQFLLAWNLLLSGKNKITLSFFLSFHCFAFRLHIPFFVHRFYSS